MVLGKNFWCVGVVQNYFYGKGVVSVCEFIV